MSRTTIKTNASKVSKDDSHVKHEKQVSILCQTCSDAIGNDATNVWRAYDSLRQRPIYFCSVECCARWFAEEIEYFSDEVGE